jgi:hypothetical protein
MMLKLFAQASKYIIIVALCVSCCAMNGCVESSFELANTSRLPQWIAIPPGLTRADVSVTMNYSINPLGRDVTFIEKDKKGRDLTKVSGKLKGLYPLHLKNPPAGFDPGYPAYEIVTLGGTTEIIEHRKMEPTFYVSDDSSVSKELLTAPENHR